MSSFKQIELTKTERLALDISASPRLECFEKDTGRYFNVVNGAWQQIHEPSVGTIGANSDAASVTPADSDLAGGLTQAVYVGGAGDLAVRMASGADVTFVGVSAGHMLSIRVKRIRAATTATNIVAIF